MYLLIYASPSIAVHSRQTDVHALGLMEASLFEGLIISVLAKSPPQLNFEGLADIFPTHYTWSMHTYINGGGGRELLLSCAYPTPRQGSTGTASGILLSPAPLDALLVQHAVVPPPPSGFTSLLACKPNESSVRVSPPFLLRNTRSSLVKSSTKRRRRSLTMGLHSLLAANFRMLPGQSSPLSGRHQ